MCVQNEVEDEVLGSYAQERIPHVKAYISRAVSLGELIYSDDPVAALVAINGRELGERHGKIKSISPRLGKADFFTSFTSTTQAAGQLFGQPVLSNGLRMDEVYEYRTVLISRDFLGYNLAPVISAEMKKLVSRLLDKLGAYAVLLRPDRYILATANDKNESKKLCDLASHAFGSTFKAY